MIATVISVTALLASLFSLGWQLSRARWERPVVVVRGVTTILERYVPTVVVAGRKAPPAETYLAYGFSMTVVNVGERAVTVVDWGWRYESDPTSSMSARGKSVPNLPLRLEPHDSRTWSMDQPLKGSGLGGKTMIPFARVVQRPTWREIRRGVNAERDVSGAPDTVPASPVET